jgi:hypothetical protein
MTYVYVLLIYISVGDKLELTSAQTRLERDECILLAEDINADSGTEIAACMPVLQEPSDERPDL